eukprot:COSAG02_NODE_119_length_35335_cov_12.823192_9_plen_410_part_00
MKTPFSKRQRRKKLHPSKTFVIRTQHPSLEARKENAADEALRDCVTALETQGDWWHPTGRSWRSPLKILLGVCHPAYRNTHAYLQPEKQEHIVDMIESYLSMLALFNSLVGVAAIEMSMHPVDLSVRMSQNGTEMLLLSISRCGWFALGPICLTSVAAGIHVLWSIQAVPVSQRRKHLLNNELYYSMPYSIAPLTFLLLHVSIFSGCLASVLRSQSNWLKIAEICGMVIGFIPVFPLVYASGAMIQDAFRPWMIGAKKQGHDGTREGGERQSSLSDLSHEMTDTRNNNSKGGPSGEHNDAAPSCEELRSNLQCLGLEFCQDLILLEGLTWVMMRDIIKTTSSYLLVDRMLESAGIAKAGHRAAIILMLHEDIQKTKDKEDLGTDDLRARLNGDDLDLDALDAELAINVS